VRRADNALVFEDVGAAVEFSRIHHIGQTLPVHRLAPYLMPLLQRPRASIWKCWTHNRNSFWYLQQSGKFDRN
jgi:hypothetical protein